MKKERFTHRVSLGLNDAEWKLLHQALRKEHAWATDDSDFDSKHRTRMIRIAMCAAFRAVIRQGLKYPWSCDIRAETYKELAERVGEKTAKALQPVKKLAIVWTMPPRNNL
jgi:hypothetical protein